MIDVLAGLRARVGPEAPARDPEWDRHAPPPGWRPETLAVWWTWRRLRSEGQLHLAFVVRAELALWETADLHGAIALVHTADRVLHALPHRLAAIGRWLEVPKGEAMHELDATSRRSLVLAGEVRPALASEPLSPRATGGARVLLARTRLWSAHLPHSRLMGQPFPIVVCPAKGPMPERIAVVPHPLWPTDLLERWA